MKHKQQNRSRRARRIAPTKPRKAPARRPVPVARSLPRRTRSGTAEGIFTGTSRGYGFVFPDGAEKRADADIFIPAGKTGGALDGDRVAVRFRAGYESRTEGEVTAILSEGRTTVIGVLVAGRPLFRGRRSPRDRFRSGWSLIPDDAKLPGEFPVLPSPDADPGDRVEIVLPGRRGGACKIVRVFGRSTDVKATCDAILAGAGIEPEFDPTALREAEFAAAEPLGPDGRVDLTRDLIFTIDGADAKDLDDAVSLKRLPGGRWLLGVHIADVSSYVAPGSALEAEAMRRGTSVYFLDRVIPMLPLALSNGACSLNANEDKRALSALITLAPDGAILSCELKKSVIRSRVRGVYSEVNSLFSDGETSPFYPKYRGVYPALTRMRELYLILSKRSAERGALSLDRPEPIFTLDGDGLPVLVSLRERGDAEKMIEQFMLTANEAVATLLHSRGIPCVYRIHEDPDPVKLAAFKNAAAHLALDVSGIDLAAPGKSVFAPLLLEAEEKGISEQVSLALLRAMAKARYEAEPRRHFGLGIDLYCHFTSPIRRLSDLATHRIISEALLGASSPRRFAGFARDAADAASAAELRALDAERKIEAVYRALYLEKHVGEVFDARVSSLTSFGLFAELDNTCEGMVPLSDLPGVYIYNESEMALIGGKIAFHLGDRITVRVEEVDALAGRVRFSLV
ncbi:MAG: VacB/RNase II family 3'-5' exoribonuclease [Clostridia bacterium]|nr:VacB/RNase II family 3'-5' exoribonuclease [Clostridia bacterium]